VTNAKLATAALAVMAVSAALSGTAFAQARDQIRVVGSSTVFPFTTAVAENFGRSTSFRPPIVESTGTGGGMRLFCAGVGPSHPDVSNASRRITKSEFDTCRNNGVTEIVELKIGFDGIVVTTKRGAPKFNLTREQMWRALARQVPVNGQWVNNPHTTWQQVDASLPNSRIEVLGPPPTSGTRDSFAELMLEGGCRNVAEVRAVQDAAQRLRYCTQIREDGRFIEGGENDNLIVQRIAASDGTVFGVFGYSFLEENLDKIEAKLIDGVEPKFETISEGKYPVARDMFVYFKKAHIGVIPGIREFMAEYVSERAMGDNGYLEQKGLVILPQAALRQQQEGIRTLTSMTSP
jgi:phosphate transport system substrate-binding protein